MNLRFTRSALADLEEIRAYLSVHYPGTQPAEVRRLQTVLSRIPKAAGRSSTARASAGRH